MYKSGSVYEELLDRVQNVEVLEGGLETWASSVNVKLDPLDEADLISRCGTLETKVSSLETGKQDKFSGSSAQYVRGDGSLASFPSIPSGQSPSDWNATSGVTRILNKPTIPTISTRPNIPDVATNAPTNAANNAPNTAPTNLNVVTTLLGALTGEVNATNTRQNQIADIVNANAVKQNAIGTIVVSIAQKLNLNFDALEANNILAGS